MSLGPGTPRAAEDAQCSKSNLTKVCGGPAEGQGPGGEADSNLRPSQ